MRLSKYVLVLALAAMPVSLKAQEEGNASSGPVPDPVSFVTQHSGTFNGTLVDYTATAGETYVFDEADKPRASYFTTTYTKNDVDNAAERPVTFIFNGGPGSASLWLQMGVFGPKRVDVSSDPEDDGAPPYPIVDNTMTLLDITDMVFIDPIGTGYSRVVGDGEGSDHWGVMEDANSVADFIQAWITNNGRWNSPKYVAGESYGTVRAAVLSDVLNNRGISLNGIVLISAVLDYQNSRPQEGAIMGFVSFLPTFAATAWYHGKVEHNGRTLEQFLDEVREFARTDYAMALISNNRLSVEERADIVRRTAAYTGLSERYVDDTNMRILVFRFFKELLRDESVSVGRLDSRYIGEQYDDAGEFPDTDPSMQAINSAFTAAINTHMAENLNVTMDRTYVTGGGVGRHWNWVIGERAPNGGRYINLIPYLGRAMRRNKDLRVLLTSGYYDFATPFFGAENALSEDGIVHENVSYTYYEAGHMMYLHQPSRVKFLADVRAFIEAGGE